MADNFLRSGYPFGRISVDGLSRRTVGAPVEHHEPDEEFLTDQLDESDAAPSRWQRMLVRLASLILGVILLVYLLSGWNPLWSVLTLCCLLALAAISGASRYDHEDSHP